MSSSEKHIRNHLQCEAQALNIAKRVLNAEAQAILAMKEQMDQGFLNAVDLVFRCAGKVLVSGVGKSGYIGRKIASTLASTGTQSFFIHPAEAIHGDLGMASKNDVFLFISKSGETGEIISLIPFIKRLGCAIVSMTGRKDSTLGRNSDVIIPVDVPGEACPLGLAPTASTTAVLAVGDALAVTLLEMRGFSRTDFARLHPGGVLGKKLLLTVGDIMHTGDALPMVHEETPMREAIFEITSKGLGVTGVKDQQGELVGVITDGDLRRALEKGGNLLQEKTKVFMTHQPKWIHKQALAVDALNCMQTHAITSLFVFDTKKKKKLEGIIHLHDILRAGVV
jgi:arabinose-5-phosphate isomerase